MRLLRKLAKEKWIAAIAKKQTGAKRPPFASIMQ